ncbi:cyclophilin-like fold protein [Brachybacterium subflavum]|uniref:cyclophilin-like fold protein n=1 Tax=Brachybacterium subflavum TaxID=2585206 RepID=UPI0012667754|nr:cyclophilin-like fold protein [Brachybacterium subflavum]
MTDILGTALRFHNDRTSIDASVDQDNPTVRSLIAQLPLEGLEFADNQGLEKLVRLDQGLDFEGSPASGNRPGDVICSTPRNSIAFWYGPDGFEPREELVHIGRYDASAQQLEQLTASPVIAHLVAD